MPAAAAEPSKEMPHALTFMTLKVLSWSMVLMAVPVVTTAWAAVVGIGPLMAL